MSISFISNVENPGVSAIYEFSSILYSTTCVVVFFPLLFLLLIFPSCAIVFPNSEFINVDFPTPEFPENAVTLFFKYFFISSTPMLFLASVFITSYPMLLYKLYILSILSSSSKSILFKQIIGFIFIYSAYTNCLSKSNKSGFGNFIDTTKIICDKFAILGLFI